jgi:outer membrane protein TolC
MRYFLTSLILLLFIPCFSFAYLFDFSYQNLINQALIATPEIQNARYEVDSALLDEKSANYKAYPTLHLDLYGFPIIMDTYYNKENQLAFDFGYWRPAIGSKITTTVPIATFGRISNAQKAAFYKVKASREDVLLKEAAVIEKVKNLYWGYLSFNAFRKYVFEVILPKVQDIVDTNQKKFNEGKIGRKKLEDSKIRLLEIKKSELELNNNKKYLDTSLSLFTKNSAIEELQINFKIKYIFPLKPDIKPFEYYLDLARKNHPLFRKMQDLDQADFYYTKFRKADKWPIIGFGLSVGYNYFDFPVPIGGDRYFPANGVSFSVGFNLSWDIAWWNTGNESDKYENSHLQNVEKMKIATQSLENSLQNSYNNLKYQLDRLDYQNEILKIAQRSVIFSSNAKSMGNVSDEDYANSITVLFDKLRDYYKQILNLNTAIAHFEAQLGQDIVDYSASEENQAQEEIFLTDSSSDNAPIESAP